MPFTIPNLADAAHESQAGPDSGDLAMLQVANSGTGVFRGGLLASANGSGMTVDVSEGALIQYGNAASPQVISGATLHISAADHSDPRFDLIAVDIDGTTLIVIQGTPTAEPDTPFPPFTSSTIGQAPVQVVLAAVYVGANVTVINSDDVVDKRFFPPPFTLAEIQANPAGNTWTATTDAWFICDTTVADVVCEAVFPPKIGTRFRISNAAGTNNATFSQASLVIGPGATVEVTYTVQGFIPESAYDPNTASQAALDAEIARAEAAEALLAPRANPTFTGAVVVPDSTSATHALNTETADGRYTTPTALAAETTRAEGAESTLQTNINTETSRAEAAEALLAPKASPTFTGTVTVPDPTTNTGALNRETGDSRYDASGAATTVQGHLDTEVARAEAAEALLIPLSQKAANSGVATLDSGGKVPTSQLPATTINEVFVVSSLAAMLALPADVGDVAVQSNVSTFTPNTSYMLQSLPASTQANWIQISEPGQVVSVNGQTGVVTGLAEESDLLAEVSRAEAAEALLAPKASPTFTGTVVVPDPTTNTGALNRETGDARYDSSGAAATVQTNLNSEITRAEAAEATLLIRMVPSPVKTGGYTASPNEFVPVDTTGGSVAILLPNAPADGTTIGVKQVIQGGTNVVSYTTQGSDVINRAAGRTTGTLTLLSQGVVLQYKASSHIWYVVSDDLPLSQLDGRYVPPARQVATTSPIIGGGGLGADLDLSWDPHAAQVLYELYRRSDDAYRSLRAKIQAGGHTVVGFIGGSNIEGEGSTLNSTDDLLSVTRQQVNRWANQQAPDKGFIPAFSFYAQISANYFNVWGFGTEPGVIGPVSAPAGCTPTLDGAGGYSLSVAAGQHTPAQADPGHKYLRVYLSQKSTSGNAARLYVSDGSSFTAKGSATDCSGGNGGGGKIIIDYNGDLSHGWYIQNDSASAEITVNFAERSPVAISTGREWINAGHGGADAVDFIVAGQYHDTVTHFTNNPADHYVISVGLNAVFDGESVSTFQTNLTTLVNELNATNTAACFTLDLQWRGGLFSQSKIPPSISDWLNLWHGAVRTVADYIIGTLGVGCDLFSTWEQWGNLYDGTSNNAGADIYSLLSSDHIHPNAKAYSMAGNALGFRMVPERSLPPAGTPTLVIGASGQVVATEEVSGSMKIDFYASIADWANGHNPLIQFGSLLGAGFFGMSDATGDLAGFTVTTANRISVVNSVLGAGLLGIAPGVLTSDAASVAQAKSAIVVSGKYTGPDQASRSTTTLTLNRVYYEPIFLSRATTLAALAAEYTTAVATSVIRLGAYASAVGGGPGALLYGGPTIATSGTPGLVPDTGAAATVVGPGWVYFAIVGQVAAPTMRSYTPVVNLPLTAPNGAGPISSYVQAGITGALPNPAVPADVLSATIPPLVWFQV